MLSAAAVGAVMVATAIDAAASPLVIREFISSTLLDTAGLWRRRRSVPGGGVTELPDRRGAQLVGGLRDQVGRLVFVGVGEVVFDIGHDVGVAPPGRDLVADAVPVCQCVFGVGEVVTG